MKEVTIPENIPSKQHSDYIDGYTQGQTDNIDGLTLDSEAQENENKINNTKEFPAQKKRGGWQGLTFGIGIGVVASMVSMQLVSQSEKKTEANTNSTQTITNPVETNVSPALSVTVANVELATVERTLDATGSVVAFDLLPVLPQANGLQIQQVLVDEGEKVTQGQVMAILDDSVLKSQINQAKSQVASARSQVEQRRAAHSKTEVEVKQAIAAWEQAIADRDGVKANIAQAKAGRDEAIAALQQTQASRDDAIAALKQTQASRNDAIAALQQTQASRNDALASVAQTEARLAEAKANQEQAMRDFERYQTLRAEGVISSQELETRSTTVKTSREGVRVAEANINSAKAKVDIADANISSAKAKVDIADANIDSAKAKVDIAGSNVRSAEARVESAEASLSSSMAQLRSAEAKVNSAQANVSSARAEVESALSNIDSAMANVSSEEARKEEKQTELAYTLVKAPANGIIAERIARVGDVTSSSKMLFSIIKNNQLELELEVPETQLPQVKIGTKVRISSDADSRIKMSGRVREIAPLVNEETREATVKIDLPNSNLLRPGMFLRATITTATNQGFKIPAKAVLPQADGQSIAYVLQSNNQVKAVPVEVGEILSKNSDLANAEIEIKEGLKLGDRIVVSGAGYLKDGDIVKVIDK
ncbi:MAG: efflux RND transporter periplasmic adaptor subunit [Okeania sp. SIO3I5]|uniref:efflux RND transporter periplasmic adaptor subunit n=1 Tax=Okeania sp. SIO3I5 TaxID=2607805 RepID=UPI0013BD2234|nr:efflux RND transporter periplasmic adaptor subunit [Okeania sp. SIO3I5]NEQ35905.1 efflux RND transporter periplasmic adaptor subunit [Okeania sp. SIO3I5]